MRICMCLMTLFVLIFLPNKVDAITGIHSFATYFPHKEARLGVIANQTSCTLSGRRTIDVLKESGYTIALLFATEHGFHGNYQASAEVKHDIDADTGTPIVSLYGQKIGNSRIKEISSEHMACIDALVFDVQEAGVRHYTYLDTLLRVLQSAAIYNKPIIVCDRPNLLGSRMDGPTGNMALFKQETVGSLPLRHGMTIGEIARYFNEHVLTKKADLYIVPLESYERTDDTTSFFMHRLSPNINTPEAVYGYSFLGALGEVRPFDLGIGTPQAFQIICLPDTQLFARVPWNKLCAIMHSYGIGTKSYRYFSDRKKKWFKGIELVFDKGAHFKSFELLLDIIEFCINHHISITFSDYFDTAIGDFSIRQWIAGACTKQEVIERAHISRKHFLERVSSSLLYTPGPKISLQIKLLTIPQSFSMPFKII